MPKVYDPKMHSAEHLLNQTMVRMFNCGRSFSAHIEKKKSKCDYHFDRDLQPEEISELERRINSEIDKNHSVTEEFIELSEAQSSFNLEKLPDDVGGKIRIIKIGDYDSCPCIGTHVKSTTEIGAFKIISTGYDDGVLRIRFRLEEK